MMTKAKWLVALFLLVNCTAHKTLKATKSAPQVPPAVVEFSNNERRTIVDHFNSVRLLEAYLTSAHVFGNVTGVEITADRAFQIWAGLSVHVINKPWDCTSELASKEPVTCRGTTHKTPHGYHINIALERCLPMSSFVHELMHVFSSEVFGNADPNHRNDLLFQDASGEFNVKAAQNIANATLVHMGHCDGTSD